jgi:hypothetical protein
MSKPKPLMQSSAMQSATRSGAAFACATCCCMQVIMLIDGGDGGGHDYDCDCGDDDYCCGDDAAAAADDDYDDDDNHYDEVNEFDAIHQASTSATRTHSTFSSKVSTAVWTARMAPAFLSTSQPTATCVHHLQLKPHSGYLKFATGCSRV